MISKDEALNLALEALGLYQAAGFGNSTDFNKQHEAFYKAQNAITAVKQALNDATHLVAPVQEPVGEVREYKHRQFDDDGCVVGSYSKKTVTPDVYILPHRTKLYTTPPYVATPLAAQRQWVGLTEADRTELAKYWSNPSFAVTGQRFIQDYGNAIETKLKEKNA